jgi:hypothetical protein
MAAVGRPEPTDRRHPNARSQRSAANDWGVQKKPRAAADLLSQLRLETGVAQ